MPVCLQRGDHLAEARAMVPRYLVPRRTDASVEQEPRFNPKLFSRLGTFSINMRSFQSTEQLQDRGEPRSILGGSYAATAS
jgi:hypothetical protein